MARLRVLGVLCGILQIAGVLTLITMSQLVTGGPEFIRILLGIAGFASVVRFFLPDLGLGRTDTLLRPLAAIAGLALIVAVCIW